MHTVNFQCGHCGKLMAVTGNLLGQQVRCPHCQQVVLAPAPAAVTPPAVPTPAVPEPDRTGSLEEESIFTPPESDSALFGEVVQPVIELPPAPPAPGADGGPAPAPPEAHPAPSSLEPTVLFEEARPPASAGIPSTTEAAPVTAAPTDAWPAGAAQAPAAPPEGLPDLVPPQALRPVRASGGLFLALVLIPLISYSILATIAVVILYLRPAPPDPLEQLPDLEGEYKGATQQKHGAVSYERVRPDRELPASLRVALGKSLRVGDLEVTPRKVELRRLVFHTPGFEPERAGDDSLVLYLHLRNASQDVVFCPTDPFFERRWKPTFGQSNKPYMFLVAGSQKFYGGPVDWRRRVTQGAREVIEGQQYQYLKPGEELDSFVCTDPQDRVGKFLTTYHGHLLWRVQLRRGVVPVRGRDISATAVIGVDFDADAVQRPAA